LELDGEHTDYLCEIKFSEHEFTIDKQYEKELSNKIDGFISSKQHKGTHSVQLVMITTTERQKMNITRMSINKLH